MEAVTQKYKGEYLNILENGVKPNKSKLKYLYKKACKLLKIKKIPKNEMEHKELMKKLRSLGKKESREIGRKIKDHLDPVGAMVREWHKGMKKQYGWW